MWIFRRPALPRRLLARNAATHPQPPTVLYKDLTDPAQLGARPTDVRVGRRTLRIPANIPYDAANKRYRFRSVELEAAVFTHASVGVRETAWAGEREKTHVRDDNEQLEWLGDGILKSATAMLIDAHFPGMSEAKCSALMSALINNRFYAHLARKVGITDNLRLGFTTNTNHASAHKVLGSLFEAYVGGMYRELGVYGYPKIYEWLEELVLPYARAFMVEIDTESPVPQHVIKGVNYSRGTKKLRLPAPLTGLDDRSYSNWVHEFCSVNHYMSPDYTYARTDKSHLGKWKCSADLGVEKFSAIGQHKTGAKESVCKAIYDYIQTCNL